MGAWLRRLFAKAEPEKVWAICNNCFHQMYIPKDGDWWCECEGHFMPMTKGKKP